MMNDIILVLYDLSKSYLTCTLLAFTLIIHTTFKYWLANKKKDESLLVLMHKKILSLESANQDLQNRLLNLESANLMQELQSINNKCIAKIGFVDNKYEYLMDRTLTPQSEVVTTQTLCKEERLSLIDKIRSLESCVSEEHNRWYDSMKNLEFQAREEVHSLEQTLCARLHALEETLCKHDKEPNKQKGKTIKVVTSPNGSNPMAYPVIIHERPADDTHPEPYVIHTLQPISIRDFKNMKEAIVTYGIHSTYVKQMLNSWSTSNRIIPDDWHQLTSAVLEYSQQLQWKSWLREEARNLEQQGILMQREDVILEWIFLPRKPNKKLKTYIEKISDLIHKGDTEQESPETLKALDSSFIPDLGKALDSSFIPDLGKALDSSFIPDLGKALDSSFIPDLGKALDSSFIPDLGKALDSSFIPDLGKALDSSFIPDLGKALDSSFIPDLGKAWTLHSSQTLDLPGPWSSYLWGCWGAILLSVTYGPCSRFSPALF
ncbi:hypothetical protein STEG23_024384 [Scotinomys teguina]